MKRVFKAELDYVKTDLLLSHLAAFVWLFIFGGIVALLSRIKNKAGAEEPLMFFLLCAILPSHFYILSRLSLGLDGKQRSRLKLHAGLPMTIYEWAATETCLLLTLWLAAFALAALYMGFVYLIGGISIVSVSLTICGLVLWLDGLYFIIAQMGGIWDNWKKMRILILIVALAILFGPIFLTIEFGSVFYRLAPLEQMVDYYYLIASAGLGAPGLYLVGLVLVWGGYVLFGRRRSYLT